MRLRVQEVKRGQDDNNDTRGEKREEREMNPRNKTRATLFLQCRRDVERAGVES